MEPTPPFDLTLSRLIKILKYEKEQLLLGAYGELAAISKTKRQYIEILDAHESSLHGDSAIARYAAGIDAVKKLAKENETLLKSAQSGVVAAQTRIEAINNSESMVGTYTQEGDKLRTRDAAVTRRKIA